MIAVALSCEIRIFFLPVERVFGCPESEPPLFTIEQGNSYAQCSKIHACDNCAHGLRPYIYTLEVEPQGGMNQGGLRLRGNSIVATAAGSRRSFQFEQGKAQNPKLSKILNSLPFPLTSNILRCDPKDI